MLIVQFRFRGASNKIHEFRGRTRTFGNVRSQERAFISTSKACYTNIEYIGR
jgi:hypothetical protein